MFDITEAVASPDVDWPDFDPGAGPQWSSYLPDGMLADTLERQCGEGSQWERLERIGAWERVVAWAQANQLREMASFAHGAEQDAAHHAEERAAARVAGELVAPEVAQIDGLESAAAEISLMLRIAPGTATARLDDALTLTTQYPATVTALAAGRITLCKARIIAEQTEQLAGDHASAVEARVLDRATTQTPVSYGGQCAGRSPEPIRPRSAAATTRPLAGSEASRSGNCPTGWQWSPRAYPPGKQSGSTGYSTSTPGHRRTWRRADLGCAPR